MECVGALFKSEANRLQFKKSTNGVRGVLKKEKVRSPVKTAAFWFAFGLFFFSSSRVPDLRAQSFEAFLLTGQWQPQTLTTQNTASLFAGSAKSTPYFQVCLCEPIRSGLFFGQALGYWHQKEVNTAEVRTLSLVPVNLFLKHRLVVDSPIMPYVSYGGGAVLALRHSRNPSVGLPPQVGMDIFVETGIDAHLRRPFGAHLSFAYHYTKFQADVGETDDFTGPQGMFGIFWQF